ncbi:hypothetical protein DN92_02885 [Polynucleobacter arcticus]|uniref:DUF1579 domain-containing protein n=2 Tax=Polynucleobacter arcticus TaxID=1743165 RepID=A0A6M9PQG3_9BURK|nr:hypothetical protein DN92_02885 [Polynucleobacter arcticus]
MTMSDSNKQAPNVIGTWIGKTNDAVIGGGSHYPNGEKGEVRFLGLTVTYQFDKQSNRAFAGTFTIEGHTVQIVGSFSRDLMSGTMADKDGIYTFKMSGPNEMSVCFASTTTDRYDKSAGPVADCHDITRQA